MRVRARNRGRRMRGAAAGVTIIPALPRRVGGLPMATRNSHVPIAGSEYVPLTGASVGSPVDPHSLIGITIVVRSRRPAPDLHSDRELAERLPRERTHLSR